MKPWVKYLILAASSVFANSVVALILGWITGTWPPAGTTWPYVLVGYVVAAVWYFLFVRPEYNRAFSQIKTAHDEATAAAVDKALEGMIPDRKKPLASETGNRIVEILARGLADVYGNDVNDSYREKAREIYPDMVTNVYDIVIGEMEAERAINEESGEFLKTLETERLAMLATYSDRVRNDFPSLAKGEWEGLQRVTDQIENEKERIRNLGRRRD